MAAGGSGAAAPEATAAGEGGGIVPGSSRELAAGSCRAPAGAGSSRRSARPVPLAAQVKARWAGAAAGPLSSAESGAVGERVGSRDPAGRGTDGWRESCGGQLRAGRVTRGPQEELDNALLGKLAAEGKAGVGERAVVAEAALRVWCRLLFSAFVPCCCGISSRCPHAAAVFLLCPHPFPLPSRCFPSWSFPCHSFPAPPSHFWAFPAPPSLSCSVSSFGIPCSPILISRPAAPDGTGRRREALWLLRLRIIPGCSSCLLPHLC